jgi:hypothetical protein
MADAAQVRKEIEAKLKAALGQPVDPSKVEKAIKEANALKGDKDMPE